MKKLKMVIVWLALVVFSICFVNSEPISDRRLCADEQCTKIISMARTMLNYSPIEPYMIPFQRNKIVRILSKAAGSNTNVWGIEVQGRRGYAPITHLQETEVIVKADQLIEVPTEPYIEKPADTEASAEAKKSIDESTVKEETVSSEGIDNNATIAIETQEQQAVVDDKKVVSDSEKEISQQTEPVGEQQQIPEIIDNKVVSETVKEIIETIKPLEEQKEIREHDDEDDEGFDEEDEDNIDLDEDEVKDYAGREPVTEPPVIKKHAYQTGDGAVENLENANVKLEIIGSDAKQPNDNSTVPKVESNAKTIEELAIEASEQKVETDAGKTEHESQFEKTPEATSELPLADSTAAAASAEIINEQIELNETIEANEAPKNAVETNVVTDEPKPSEAKIEVDKIDENMKPDENVSDPYPFVAPEASVPPPDDVEERHIVIKKTTAKEVTNSGGDDFHDQIKNVLDITQEPVVASIPQLPSYLNPSMLADKIEDASAEHHPNEQLSNPNTEDNIKENREVPIVAAVDPIQIVETTEAPNVVEETSAPAVEKIDDVPEIEEEVLQIPDEVYPEVPVPTTPLPSLESEDIFMSKASTPGNGQENVETVEATGNWYDGIVETVYDGYASVIRLYGPGATEKPDVSDDGPPKTQAEIDAIEDGYCEKLDDGTCPKHVPKSVHIHDHVLDAAIHHVKNVNYDAFAQEFLSKVVAMADVVILLALTATAVLIFILGHYCLANNQKESALISKLNIIEKKLLVSQKECSIVKADLIQTRKQLVSIEDSSFGSNDMVIALKQQLEESENEKQELQQQIVALEKELETAAEAGLELNKMVSELLNNQSGSDSIISSVEELQRQLNEQEAMTISINNLLAEKSRENSELQILLSEKNGKFETEIEELLKLNDVLKMEKESIEGELRENIHSLETQLNRELEAKASELTKLRKEHAELRAKFESVSTKCQLSVARADALEDTLKKLKQIEGKADLKTVIEATDANAKLLALSRENETLKDQLEGENDARNLLEDHVKVIGDEITKLRAEYNQAEKDKLEAQTRLEVLSNYFKEKETQLQKELSVKEALFMKQQGESTSTVERIRSLQDEIQELKSQNDQLRAEIDAQSAAHKAQINAAESRAHDSWLAAKQAERRFEEIRSEAAVLRRKLTSLSTNPASVENSLQNHLNGDGLIPSDMNAPSPIHMESPGSPLMNLVPPNTAPFLPPPPFIGAPPMNLPFMPPPPLVPIPPGEMRPPPLGRLMSPPPPPPPLHPSSRFQPNNFVDDRGRYDNRFSPDSRYDDYPDVSMYETETDFSPPRSPEPRQFYRDRNDYDDDDDYSPRPSPTPVDNRKRKSVNKGGISSGSIDSSTSRKSRGGTSKN